MALFGDSRDISFFRHINKELINNIIQTEVDIYVLNLADTKSNIYGESSKKTYYTPVRVAALISRDPNIDSSSEIGVDSNQQVQFGFLRDGILDAQNIIPSNGDIIEWDERYWEIDMIEVNQYILGRNDMTNKTIGSEFGANWSYICKTHLTRIDKLNIVQAKFGNKK